jgi:hypothetical protein
MANLEENYCVRLIKMCMHELSISARVGKYLYESSSVYNRIKQGDVPTPSNFNFSLEYAISNIQMVQEYKLRTKILGIILTEQLIFSGNFPGLCISFACKFEIAGEDLSRTDCMLLLRSSLVD